MECPECKGEGGFLDYFGEWADCNCCQGERSVTPERLAEYQAEMAEIDRMADEMAQAEGREAPTGAETAGTTASMIADPAPDTTDSAASGPAGDVMQRDVP